MKEKTIEDQGNQEIPKEIKIKQSASKKTQGMPGKPSISDDNRETVHDQSTVDATNEVKLAATASTGNSESIVPTEIERRFIDHLTSNPRATTQELSRKFHINPVQISLLKKKYFPENPLSLSQDQIKSTGERAARVFEQFEGGRKPHEVVISLKLPPDEIIGFWEQYQKLKVETSAKNTVSIEEPEIQWACSICGEQIVWDLRSQEDCTDLVEILEAGGINTRSCTGCGGTRELLSSWKMRNSQR
jgi:predicted RNA-binding Zn-ribbon protein involved in translation (DUF1610 family)